MFCSSVYLSRSILRSQQEIHLTMSQSEFRPIDGPILCNLCPDFCFILMQLADCEVGSRICDTGDIEAPCWVQIWSTTLMNGENPKSGGGGEQTIQNPRTSHRTRLKAKTTLPDTRYNKNENTRWWRAIIIGFLGPQGEQRERVY